MTEERASDTRARILEVALDEFAARGYHATSVRRLAERVGVTKTAVLYHFPGKADIVAALAAPLLADLDAAMAAADLPDTRRARWAAIEGLLEVLLAHRYLLRMNLYDLALASSGSVFQRFRDGMIRANILVAGPGAGFTERVRASQAIAMLADPVVLFADVPDARLRAAVLGGVRRFLASSGPGPDDGPDDGPDGPDGPDGSDGSDGVANAATTGGAASTDGPAGTGGSVVRAKRARRGRPGVMDAAMAETARRMYDEGSGVAEIASALGVSRATVYRHLSHTG
ncbi:TetR family transcriptional regulator [Microbispora sp. NPDC049125]|uniref:TetR family transcriptional regulator n=1 Tax=Microbispora sp. NPDC049125 TaxID=3154929 RepID=UPI003465D9F4